MLITTSYSPTAQMIQFAENLAEQSGGRRVDRKGLSIAKLMQRHDEREVLVVQQDLSLKYYCDDAPPLFFHPGSAMFRIKRMLSGEVDPLIRIAGIEPGCTVLDCTAGLAADAIVFAFAVGPKGQVIALESEYPIYRIVSEGLRSYQSGLAPLDEAMRMIDLRHGHHLDVLKQAESRSVDVIYFDPMFENPVHESISMMPLRAVANESHIQEEAIHEARRVARRCIVLKERRSSTQFVRLGFEEVHRSYSNMAYGVIRL